MKDFLKKKHSYVGLDHKTIRKKEKNSMKGKERGGEASMC
jgi:hypothetical protein